MSRWRPPSGERKTPYITAQGYARLKAEYDQLWRGRRPEVVRALITAWRAGPHGIVAPVHDDRRGHPVLFDATHLGRLRACSGDVGARALLEEHPVHLVEVDSPGVLLDLDPSADLHARRRMEGHHG